LLTPKYDFFHKNSGLCIFREVQSWNAIWDMEIEPKRGIFSFVIFYNTLQDTNVEWYVTSINREQDGVIFLVNVDKLWLEIFRQIFSVFVALDFGTINGFLFFEISPKIFIASLLKLLQLLFLQNHLMLMALFLIFQLLVCLLLNLPSFSFNDVAVCFRFSLFFSLFLIFQRIRYLC